MQLVGLNSTLTISLLLGIPSRSICVLADFSRSPYHDPWIATRVSIAGHDAVLVSRLTQAMVKFQSLYDQQLHFFPNYRLVVDRMGEFDPFFFSFDA